MQNLRLCVPALAAVLSMAAAACDNNDKDFIDSTLVVVNNSDFVIVQIFLTEVDNIDWGPNVLGGDVLFPDEELTVAATCGFFDVLIVDEDGIECELHDLDLCLNNATFVFNNDTCDVFNAARAAREAAEAAGKAPALTPSPTPSPTI